jgi:hypothetical protein
MLNKLKIAAAFAVVIAGMILYKNHSEKKERDKEGRKSKTRSARTKDKFSVN